MRKFILWTLLALAFSGCASVDSQQWYKGNTHTHTLWSDGDDFPEMAADWYKRHGYHFLVLSDHNIMSQGEKFKNVSKHVKKNDIVAKHESRWGTGVLEKEIDGEKIRVKLKTLEQVRSMVAEPGRFIMIEGLEITSSLRGKENPKQVLPVHSNPVNVDELLMPEPRASVDELLDHHAELISGYMARADHPVFWHINHPNFKYAITAEQVARVLAAQGLEIFNASGGCNNQGNEEFPSAERIWDIVNTIRLKEYGVPPLFGCATDDTHRYHTPENQYHSGEVLHDAPGLAWVMVRAASLTPDTITQAMRRGDFYASTGVALKDLQYDAKAGVLSLEIDSRPGVTYTIRFIGSPKDISLDHKTPDPVVDGKGGSHPVSGTYSDVRLGAVLKEVHGTKAAYQLTGDELYVRAVVSCDDENMAIIGEGAIQKQAWTQPVGWEKQIEESR